MSRAWGNECACEYGVGRGMGRVESHGVFPIYIFRIVFSSALPERQHAEWNKHLTFAKCWWSGPDRQGCVWWLVSSLKQEFKLHRLHFLVHNLEKLRKAGGKIEGVCHAQASKLALWGPLSWQPATSCWEPHSGHLSARVFYLGVPLRSFQEKPLGIQGQGSQAGARLRSTKL